MDTTASHKLSRVLLAAALAFAGTVASFAATTSTAMASAPKFYVVTLVAPLEAPRREIAGDKLWSCEGTRCVAKADGSHPLRTCQQVARKFGQVAAFTANDNALEAQDLARCNQTD